VLSVAAYTQGVPVPSARFRVRQHIAPLEALGVRIREYPARLSSFPPAWRPARPAWGVAAVAERVLAAACSWTADVTLLQREMVSTLATAEVLTRRPRVLDVDDAIFLHRGGAAAARLAQLCDLVICGNAFLAGWFDRHNRNVQTLPTAVDTDRFAPAPAGGDMRPVIGWSGGSSGFRYLESVAPALSEILSRRPEASLRVIADRRPRLDGVPASRVEFVRWSPETEVAALQDLTVGLMPLDDTSWSRGKCAFKLLTYMACGVPAVASAVGMNVEVLASGGGLAPRSLAEWVDAIDFYLRQPAEARRAGRQGRQIVVDRYSLRTVTPRLAGLLGAVAASGAHARHTATAGRTL
jgi:glycosyltransferase involved in cell wall biosynthesis